MRRCYRGRYGVLVALLAAQILAGINAIPLDWLVLIADMVMGLLLAVVFIPAIASSRRNSLISSQASNYRSGDPIRQRLYLDMAPLIASGLVFWKTAASGYQIVLDYAAFLAPLLFWIGGGLLVIRLVRSGLAWGQRPLARMLELFAGPIGSIVASALRW